MFIRKRNLYSDLALKVLSIIALEAVANLRQHVEIRIAS